MKHLISMAALIGLAATPAVAAPIQWTVGSGGNGHYYEYIQASSAWEAALASAGTASYLGNQGYLATVTSAAEQAFIFSSVTSSSVWFAGSDRANEGSWIWEAGPESGQVFWVGGPGGSSPNYANWAGGEPNNAGNEDYLYGNWSGSAWNDIGSTSLGYVVEYGGLSSTPAVPEPASWAMMIGGFGLVGGAMRRRSMRIVRTRATA